MKTTLPVSLSSLAVLAAVASAEPVNCMYTFTDCYGGTMTINWVCQQSASCSVILKLDNEAEPPCILSAEPRCVKGVPPDPGGS